MRPVGMPRAGKVGTARLKEVLFYKRKTRAYWPLPEPVPLPLPPLPLIELLPKLSLRNCEKAFWTPASRPSAEWKLNVLAILVEPLTKLKRVMVVREVSDDEALPSLEFWRKAPDRRSCCTKSLICEVESWTVSMHGPLQPLVFEPSAFDWLQVARPLSYRTTVLTS